MRDHIQYYKEHREEMLANQRRYYLAHRKERLQYNKDNKDKINAAHARYRKKHKPTKSTYDKDRYQNDPVFRERLIENRNRWARKNPQYFRSYREKNKLKVQLNHALWMVQHPDYWTKRYNELLKQIKSS